MLPTCPDLRYAVNRGTFVGSRSHNRDNVIEPRGFTQESRLRWKLPIDACCYWSITAMGSHSTGFYQFSAYSVHPTQLNSTSSENVQNFADWQKTERFSVFQLSWVESGALNWPLEVCLQQGAIQIHVYVTLPYLFWRLVRYVKLYCNELLFTSLHTVYFRFFFSFITVVSKTRHSGNLTSVWSELSTFDCLVCRESMSTKSLSQWRMRRWLGQRHIFLHMSSLVQRRSLSKQSVLYLNNHLLHITSVVDIIIISALEAASCYNLCTEMDIS